MLISISNMSVKEKLLFCLIIYVTAILSVMILKRIHLLQDSSQCENIDYIDIKKSVQLEKINYIDIITTLNRDKVSPIDGRLISAVQRYYVQPASILSYNLSHPEKRNPSPEQTQFIDKYLNEMQNGFYIDSGAFDGEHLSNSLFLERYRNWSGILIEPNPITYSSLQQKHRKSYSLNACLSTKKYPSLETFSTGESPLFGKVVDDGLKFKNRGKNLIHVQCFPLFTILLAIGRLDVDYLSLDVEGAERGVLDTIPWDKTNIKMLSIEHNKWTGGKEHLKHYMVTKGYDFLEELHIVPDLIFVRKDSGY